MAGTGMNYRLWTNDERTILFRMWEDGTVETATRKHQSFTWGPPIRLTEEPTEAHRTTVESARILEEWGKENATERFDAADATWTPVRDVTLLPAPDEEDE